MIVEYSKATLKPRFFQAAGLALAVVVISLLVSFICAGFPTHAWAYVTSGAQGTAQESAQTQGAGLQAAQGADTKAAQDTALAAQDTALAVQGAELQAAQDADYYAVLHEDGDLVFQAQPSDEAGVVNFPGSCAGYSSGKAPWLAQAALIESVHFDESFAGTQPKSLAFWFEGCSNLKTIDLQNLDASASTSMRSMFSGCSSLQTIEHLSTFDTSSSTYFGSMFRNCSSLTSLDVSHFDATHVGVLCFMFAGCSKLESLNMAGEGWRTSSLYLMVHVWEGCSSLKSLDLSYLDTSGVHSMAKDFNGCSSLEYLDLSGADTSEVGSLGGMFDGCTKLSTVKLGPKFTFNGKAAAPQCSLPSGMWKSSATGDVYASADVPNNMAATYTRIAGSGDTTEQPPADSPETPGIADGEYDLPDLKSSLGMFNHFVSGSQKLTVADDKVSLSFTTDGSIQVVKKISKVAIGPSSKLINTADMKEGETKYANSLLGNPLVFEGTLVSPAGSPEQYAYELEFSKPEFDQMLANDGGIFLTLFFNDKNAWHKGTSDLLLTLGEISGYSGGDTPGGLEPGTPSQPGGTESGEVIDPNLMGDGTYSVELTTEPSMIKLAGHGGLAAEPRVIVSGEDAWLVVNYRSTGSSAWRYGQMAWGSYDAVVAAGKNGVGGAPVFKSGKSAADGMGDETLDAMTFALPLKKSELVEWLVSGEPKAFTVRYVSGYSPEHDGDWWKPTAQSTMTVANPRVASKSASVPADYAAVLDALSEVPADLSVYTEASAGKLNKALAQVAGSPKSAAEQRDVDALAAGISSAVKSLETKAAAEKAAAEKAAAEKAAAEKAAAEKAAAEKAAAEKAAAEKAAAEKKASAEKAAAEKKAAEKAAAEKRAAAEKAAAEKAAAEKKAAEKAAAEKAAAKKAAKQEAAAKKITNVTVNSKTVSAKTIASAIAAAKGKVKYVKTITLGNKVQKIARGAFKKTKVTTIVVKTTKLKKKSVAGSLKSSKVKTVKVKIGKAKTNKKYAKKYKAYFAKKNAGRTAKVTY